MAQQQARSCERVSSKQRGAGVPAWPAEGIMLPLSAAALLGTALLGLPGAPPPLYLNATAANATFHGRNLPVGISQGLVCEGLESDVNWVEDEEAGYRYVTSNSIPAFPVLDYCPYGIGGLYCGAYKSCPSGNWGEAGELCVPEGSGIVLDPNRPVRTLRTASSAALG